MDYGVTAGDWPRKAECVREDPELFFPVGETGDTNRAQIRAAKAVCGRCVVRQECL
ncbi:MAG: WhiB family transcriptional regulator, partial [Candidatus Saccharibacteria bacterium]